MPVERSGYYQLACKGKRFSQTAGISRAHPRCRHRQIQCSAMIDRGTNQWQAQGDIDALAEGGVLQYRQALIVVHGEHRVSLVQHARGEQRICRVRTADTHALSA